MKVTEAVRRDRSYAVRRGKPAGYIMMKVGRTLVLGYIEEENSVHLGLRALYVVRPSVTLPTVTFWKDTVSLFVTTKNGQFLITA